MKSADKNNLDFLLNAEAEQLAEVLSEMSEEDLEYAQELLDAYSENLDQVAAMINNTLGLSDFETDLVRPKGVSLH